MITYTISQCKREVENYLRKASQFLKTKTGTTSEWEQVYRYNLLRWQRRLTIATEHAIQTNRAIIEDWDTNHLIAVIQESHNPYMAVAATQLMAEDPAHISNHDIGIIILFTNTLHSRFDIWHEINILEGELEHRKEQLYCSECDCRHEDCECIDETPAQSAGWRQSDHI